MVNFPEVSERPELRDSMFRTCNYPHSPRSDSMGSGLEGEGRDGADS